MIIKADLVRLGRCFQVHQRTLKVGGGCWEISGRVCRWFSILLWGKSRSVGSTRWGHLVCPGIIKERFKQCSIIITTVGGKKNHPSSFSHWSTTGLQKGWDTVDRPPQRNTLVLTFTLTDNFRNEKNMHVFGLLESLERSCKHTGEICKLHIEEPPPACELKEILAVRWECEPLHHKDCRVQWCRFVLWLRFTGAALQPTAARTF